MIEIEVARIGTPYYGFSRSVIDSEHHLFGSHSPHGDALDEFLESAAARLREKRKKDFLATLDFDSMSARLKEFDASEEEFFREHSKGQLLGYMRREFTLGGILPLGEVARQQEQYVAQTGLQACPRYHFGSHGGSTGFRVFPDGKMWLSTMCEQVPCTWEHTRGSAHVGAHTWERTRGSAPVGALFHRAEHACAGGFGFHQRTH